MRSRRTLGFPCLIPVGGRSAELCARKRTAALLKTKTRLLKPENLPKVNPKAVEVSLWVENPRIWESVETGMDSICVATLNHRSNGLLLTAFLVPLLDQDLVRVVRV